MNKVGHSGSEGENKCLTTILQQDKYTGIYKKIFTPWE